MSKSSIETEFDDLQMLQTIIENKFGDIGMHLTISTPLYNIPDFDSLDRVDLCMDLEKELDCEISDAEIQNWLLVDDVLQTMNAKRNG